jgi:serine/threonine protein kinase
MAPEQIEGQPCAATDQYALAIIIYEWLCGDVPFDGPAEVVMDRHLHTEPPSLQSRVSGVPLAVERVLMQALAKNPCERYASIVDFVHKLDDAWLAAAPPADEFYQLPTDKLEIPFELVSRQKQGEIEMMQQNEKANFPPFPVKSWMRVCWGFLQTCGIGLALLKGLTFVQWPWASLLSAILLAIWTIFRSVQDRRVLSLMLSILSLALVSALIVQDSTGFILVTTVGSGLCALVAATVALQSR